MKKIVILISGTGSNMKAIIEFAQANQWEQKGWAKIVAVISNKPSASGLDFARQSGIETRVLEHKEFAQREDFDFALQTMIDEYQSDLIVLAGFMRILSEGFVRHFHDQILNIHPSLLPSFVGLHTHEQALKAGVQFHGATVHLVTPQLDAGAVLAQSCVRIHKGETPDILASRILATEHRIYPAVIASWLNRQLIWENGVIDRESKPISFFDMS